MGRISRVLIAVGVGSAVGAIAYGFYASIMSQLFTSWFQPKNPEFYLWILWMTYWAAPAACMSLIISFAHRRLRKHPLRGEIALVALGAVVAAVGLWLRYMRWIDPAKNWTHGGWVLSGIAAIASLAIFHLITARARSAIGPPA